jgi:hypothetical protein
MIIGYWHFLNMENWHGAIPFGVLACRYSRDGIYPLYRRFGLGNWTAVQVVDHLGSADLVEDSCMNLGSYS